MNQSQVEVHGTLRPDGTLVLDEAPNLPPGRVRVLLHSEEQAAPPQESLVEFVQRVQRESLARGDRFMTDDELHAWIEELRADDDRIEEAYRQAEEERKRQE